MSEVGRSPGRSGVSLASMAIAAVLLAAVVTGCGSGRAHGHRTTTHASTSHTTALPRLANSSPTLATVQTVGLPSSPGPAAEAGVPMPEGPLVGWRPVFGDDFARAEWTPDSAFASCAWHGPVTTSVCTALPAAAAARWFAFPDGSHPLLSDGVFEPSQLLEIGQSGMGFSLPGSDAGLVLAGAVPKLDLTPTNTLTTALYVVRFHADPVAGYDFVFNLWPPNNDISRAGYIQFPTGPLAGNVQALVYDPGHRQTAGTVYDPDHPLAEDWDTGQRFAGWHTAVIERTPRHIEFFLDGRPVGLDDAAIPQTPLELMLQTTPQIGQSPSPVGGRFTVSWVRVYVPAAQAHS